MEKNIFDEENAFERWDKRNQRKGNDNYFEGVEEHGHFHNLKGRVQNNLGGFLRVALTLLIVLLQIMLIIMFQLFIQKNSVYFYFILELCAIIAIVTLINRNQNPSFRIAWISIITVFPIAGFLIYFLWGRNSRKRKRLDRHIIKQIEYGQKFLFQDKSIVREYISENPISGRMVKALSAEGFVLTKNNDITFYPMGENAIDAIIDEISKAKKFIFIDFFIVAEGVVWDKLHAALKKKVNEGVVVKFLYDDFGGAIRTRKYFKQILEREGFEVKIFNPITKYTGELYMNFRSHQKIVVIDGEVGFTGGFNIADEYANLVDRFGVWKDTGVKVCGEAVWGLTVVFLQMWDSVEIGAKHSVYNKYYNKEFNRKTYGDTYCEVVADGPAKNPDNAIERLYNQMIICADEYLYVTTPYLILDDAMKAQLIDASRRGVDVRIVTPGIPDKKIVYMLTNYNYGLLLEHGIKIYEYTPGFIHAKQMLSENAAIVGTVNMDYRSFYLHYENAIWMCGEKIQQDVMADFEKIFSESHKVSYEEWTSRPLALRIIQPAINIFSTLM